MTTCQTGHVGEIQNVARHTAKHGPQHSAKAAGPDDSQFAKLCLSMHLFVCSCGCEYELYTKNTYGDIQGRAYRRDVERSQKQSPV